MGKFVAKIVGATSIDVSNNKDIFTVHIQTQWPYFSLDRYKNMLWIHRQIMHVWQSTLFRPK